MDLKTGSHGKEAHSRKLKINTPIYDDHNSKRSRFRNKTRKKHS